MHPQGLLLRPCWSQRANPHRMHLKALVALALVLTACSAPGPSSTAPSPSPTASPAPTASPSAASLAGAELRDHLAAMDQLLRDTAAGLAIAIIGDDSIGAATANLQLAVLASGEQDWLRAHPSDACSEHAWQAYFDVLDEWLEASKQISAADLGAGGILLKTAARDYVQVSHDAAALTC